MIEQIDVLAEKGHFRQGLGSVEWQHESCRARKGRSPTIIFGNVAGASARARLQGGAAAAAQ
ncbi:hypothetical protein [Halomicronema sp. CCY15110]|uniref:hypothetical protein n=1 Tax=Halomicronema sp. CCY15110 TaxID=2767773 RepID=UPI0019529009|nr:hypothetical protein [Halomicronema sp. CCY15110]